MKIYYTTCNKYRVIDQKTIGIDQGMNEIPAHCLMLEEQQGDGYAVIASHDGKSIADAEGFWDHHDAAEYAGYSHACGYVN